MSAHFISLEGLDGAGKTTHIQFIRRWLEQRGLPYVLTREPGGTELGEVLRTMVLNHDMSAETELLLMFAARCEHVQSVILPALERGEWVISDRFTDASYAYQGGGRELDFARIAAIEEAVLGTLQPDLTLLLDVGLTVSQKRLAAARSPDRFEREAAAFHGRVRDAYLQRAAQFPQRIRVLNADRPLKQIEADISAALDGLS